jgi:hypothetical protein
MFNKDVFEKMQEKFGNDKIELVCEVMEYMFDLGHEECLKRELSSDFNHDRDWWKDKKESLAKT